MRTTTILVTLVVGLAACGSTEPALDCDQLSSQGTLTVGAGTTPPFSWTPACDAYLVEIRTPTGHVTWAVKYTVVDSVPGAWNHLHMPITYGVVPAGAQQTKAPETLQEDSSYTGYVWRIMPSTTTLPSCIPFPPSPTEKACPIAIQGFTP